MQLGKRIGDYLADSSIHPVEKTSGLLDFAVQETHDFDRVESRTCRNICIRFIVGYSLHHSPVPYVAFEASGLFVVQMRFIL